VRSSDGNEVEGEDHGLLGEDKGKKELKTFMPARYASLQAPGKG
jgi:hypothetical protein